MDKSIRIIVKEVLRKVRSMNEATTTGNVAGYQTPYAFMKKRKMRLSGWDTLLLRTDGYN
jgi:hypothetical protein